VTSIWLAPKKNGATSRKRNTIYYLFKKIKMQTYAILLLGAIPQTRIISYSEFKRTSQGKIKQYILHLLKSNPEGLDTRQISDISGIWVQSLTNPIKSLQDDGLIKINSIHKSTVSNRLVQVYTLSRIEG
jgi:hypothetical protein